MAPQRRAGRDASAPVTDSTCPTASHRAKPAAPDMGATNMLDVILVALAFVFFALTIGYAYACESL